MTTNYIDNQSISISRVQVYVLCRDRVAFLDEALQSIVNQDFTGYEVVVSDNSERDDVEAMVRLKYPQVRYIRRRPAMSVTDHFRAIINECNREFTVLFHDDDVMMPNYLTCMVAEFDQQPLVAAVGCNALILRNRTLTDERLMGAFSQPLMLQEPEVFLKPYLGFELEGPAPFPGYMYRTSALSGLYLDPAEGGKYSDVSFLLKVLRRGPILWKPEALMQYRLHSGNDSNTGEIGQRLRLLRYIYKHTRLKKQARLVSDYRFSYWVIWLSALNQRPALTSRKFRVVLTFLTLSILKLSVTRYAFWIRVKNRIKKLATGRSV